jgi:hypothetical protein
MNTNQSRSLPEPGVYGAIIRSVEPATSRAGNPMLVIELDLLPSHHPVRTWVVLQDGENWRLQRFCASADVGCSDSHDGPIDPELFTNRVCFIRVEHEEYRGKTQVKVKAFLKRNDAFKARPELAQAVLPVQTIVKLDAPAVVATGDEETDEIPF